MKNHVQTIRNEIQKFNDVALLQLADPNLNIDLGQGLLVSEFGVGITY